MQNIIQKISSVIDRLDQDGLLGKLTGNCVLAADIIQTMLDADGISTKIVECELIIARPDEQGLKSISLVGYNFTPNAVENQVATHVVLVTQTEHPVIIDASIGDFLLAPKHVVIAPLSKDPDPEIFCKTTFGRTELVYKIKKNIKLPNFHQRDLVARLQQEVASNQKVESTRKLAFWAVTITAINFLLNITILLITSTT